MDTNDELKSSPAMSPNTGLDADRLKSPKGEVSQVPSEPAGLTFGQKAVGLNFNPSGDDRVGQAKQRFADVIDQIGDPTADTVKRSWMYNVLRTAAISATIAAQMAVVKLLTWKD